MVKVDIEKATELAKNTVKMKELGNFPFNQKDVFPDAIIPSNVKEGSIEHSRFLFHSCSLDSMRNANKVYSAVRDIKRHYPNFSFHKKENSKLIEILSIHLGNDVFDSVKTLIKNSEILEEKYENNPINIIGNSINETMGNLKMFSQVGQGKAALLLKNMVRFRMWDFSPYEIPIKVDRHAIRISLGNGVIEDMSDVQFNDFSKYNSKSLDAAKELMIRNGYFSKKQFDEKEVYTVRCDNLTKPIEDAFRRVCYNEKISAIDLNDSLWAIGSYSCKRNDIYNCSTNCLIGCEKRLPSDSHATYFFNGADKRKNNLPLFFG